MTTAPGTPAYFERVGAAAFRATEHVGGGWREHEQHIAAALGLSVHVVELDRDTRRDDGLVLGRLSFDILGTVPVDVVDARVSVLRPGRTIELVEAFLAHDGRDFVRLRAWLLRPGDTAELGGTTLPRIAPPEETPPWDVTSVWPGGLVASLEVRRRQLEPGRASSWVRTATALVAGEEVSALAATAGLFDVANGMTVRADPREVAFPNIDLTAHLFRVPQRGWLGFDTSVSFGAHGIGLTSSVLHDELGPFGTLAQALTVRPLHG